MQHRERRQGLFTSATDAPLPLSVCLGHHCLSTSKVSRPVPIPIFLATACHYCSPLSLAPAAPSAWATTTMVCADKKRPHGRPRISLGREHTLNLWNKAISLTLVFLDVFFQHIWSISLKAGEGSPQHLNEETWEMAWTRWVIYICWLTELPNE